MNKEERELIIDKYRDMDDRLLVNRTTIEGKVIGSLWSNPDLYNDYRDLTSDSFITRDGRFYYGLGKRMADKGYEVFDEITVLTYLQENKKIEKIFNEKGGYENIGELMNIVNSKNTHTYVDDVLKSNTIIGLYREGFNIFNEITIEEGEKEKNIIPFELFKNMNSSQVAEWYDWRLQSISMDTSMGNIKIQYIDIDDDFLNSCDSGEEMGLPYDIIGKDINDKEIWGCPILSNATLGIHRGDAELIGAFSGKGKSSFVLANRVMPIVYRGEKICIMANEMTVNKYKSILLAMVLGYHFNYYKITRKHLKRGGFTQEQWTMIKKAQAYYREHYKNKIAFVDLESYGMDVPKRVIRRLSRQGVNYYIYDTFKADNMASDNTRGQLIENSKSLYQLAKKYNIGMTIVMQLAIHMENIRFLTSGCLSEAKGVKEVMSEIILFRELWDDEYDGEKYDVKPYRRVKDKETGKYLSTREYIKLNKEKRYRIFFLDKTRNDDDSQCVLYEFNGAWNIWREIGYCTPSHIDKRGK